MRRLWFIVCFCLATLPAFCQTNSKYQVATIVDVKPHAAADSASDASSYDVSLKVGGTIYVVHYTPPLGMNTVKYSVGRQLLVLVGEKTMTSNDMLGQSQSFPIISQKPAASAKPIK